MHDNHLILPGRKAALEDCRHCLSKDLVVQHEENCESKMSGKDFHQAEYASKEQQTDGEESSCSCVINGKEFPQVVCFTLHKRLHTKDKTVGCGC